MRLTIFIIIFSSSFLLSCSVFKKSSAAPESSGELVKKTQLNDIEKRKFDYFFYEASREKMRGNIQKSAMYLTECLKIDPTSSASMYELANILASNNELVKAQGLLERAIKLEPDNVWYRLFLAELYQQNKLGLKAIGIYEGLTNDYPQNDEYLYGLAQLYQKNDKPDQAIDVYEKLEKNIGLNEVVVLEKEKIFLNQGKNKLALQELENLQDKFPEEPRYYGYIADYYLYINENEKAKEYYYIVLEKDPGYALAWFSLGNLAFSDGDTVTFVDNYKKGLSIRSVGFEAKFERILPFLMDSKNIENNKAFLIQFFDILIKTHPYEAMAYVYQGNYYRAVSMNPEALESYSKALDIEDKNELIWQDYLLLLTDAQDYDLVYSKSNIAISSFPDNAFFYLLAGTSAAQLENNENALSLFEEGLTKVENNDGLKAQFLAYIGDVAYAVNDTEKAFNAYEESLKIDELNIVVLNNYSYYLTIENRNLDMAEKMSSKCVEMEPGNSTYLDTYAWVLFKRKRYFEAKYIIERAIDNGGDDSDVIIEHYGDILFMNGDKENALTQWKKALEMGNSNELLPKKIETISYIEE